MSLLAYKVLHLVGGFLLFAALGYLALRPADKAIKLPSISHGIALLLLLVSGFGMLAKLGIMGLSWPLWIWLKLVIWLLLGAALVLVRRLPRHAALWWWLFPLLGGAAAYLALYKPV